MSRFLSISLDPECLRQAAAGDRGAQRQIYEQSAGPVFALIRRLVPGRAAAEDVFQDCMITLLGRVGDFRGEAPFGAWVRQIATRHCLMHLRSPWQRARRALRWVDTGDQQARRAEAAHTLELVPAASHAHPVAEMIDLDRALSHLPATARSVVWLYDVEGLRHEEIAALFGRTVSFSKSQLARAHALLRAELGDDVPASQVVPPVLSAAPPALVAPGPLP